MSDHLQWLSANKAYLENYITWVQLRLERYSANLSTPQTAVTLSTSVPVVRKTSWFGKVAEPAVERISAPQPDLSAMDEKLAALAADLAAAEAVEPPPALIILSRQLGLSRFEQDILMLCAALELDGKTAGLCARAQANSAKATFALALQLFEGSTWDALSAHRPLRYWRLLEINQPGAEPLVTSALRADERIVSYLVEPKHQLDERLLPFVIPAPAEELNTHFLADSQQKLAENLSQYLERQKTKTNAPARVVIQLTGADAPAKLAITRQALSVLGLEPVRIAVENLPTQTSELEYLLRLWGRERLLLPVTLYIDLHTIEDAHKHSLHRLLASASGIVIVACREPQTEIDGFTLEVNKPLIKEQLAAWEEELGSRELAEQLAGQFSLDIASIQQISNQMEAVEPVVLKEQIWQACLVKTSPRLDQLAQRLDIKATWDKLVLPPESMSLLQQITAQVERRMRVYSDWGFEEKMNRGMGISVLFAGESGTGKTMAAEVMANALNLNLYRIDLSAVVSKYIGETEKNLRRLFDAAEDGGAILFFDEADALFGKRSEVKDSHDRYANIEINYLLQRIEAYRGLAILATNMKSALDQAFMRRLRFIVNFQFPAAAQRADIWRKVFPPQTPLDELDYQHLARFNLTGGSIQNIALNAAFLAAGNESPQITMPLVLESIRCELRKLDKPINEAEFRILGVAGARP
ncbi:MAG: ATP-binding protein [Cellvibrio sp.]